MISIKVLAVVEVKELYRSEQTGFFLNLGSHNNIHLIISITLLYREQN